MDYQGPYVFVLHCFIYLVSSITCRLMRHRALSWPYNVHVRIVFVFISTNITQSFKGLNRFSGNIKILHAQHLFGPVQRIKFIAMGIGVAAGGTSYPKLTQLPKMMVGHGNSE